AVSDPWLGLTMLGLIVIAIMMGFPTAFTLMGLGVIFGYIAFWIPGAFWWDNRVFDLIVQRAYGVMTNDALLSIPLFVFMGYIMERAALVDRMFHSVQLAFRRLPPSVILIAYAACAGQSIVQLYAAAMLPGFFLTGLYLVYILGWAIINPKIAPKLPPDQFRVEVPESLRRLQGSSRSIVPALLA